MAPHVSSISYQPSVCCAVIVGRQQEEQKCLLDQQSKKNVFTTNHSVIHNLLYFGRIHQILDLTIRYQTVFALNALFSGYKEQSNISMLIHEKMKLALLSHMPISMKESVCTVLMTVSLVNSCSFNKQLANLHFL